MYLTCAFSFCFSDVRSSNPRGHACIVEVLMYVVVGFLNVHRSYCLFLVLFFNFILAFLQKIVHIDVIFKTKLKISLMLYFRERFLHKNKKKIKIKKKLFFKETLRWTQERVCRQECVCVCVSIQNEKKRRHPNERKLCVNRAQEDTTIRLASLKDKQQLKPVPRRTACVCLFCVTLKRSIAQKQIGFEGIYTIV